MNGVHFPPSIIERVIARRGREHVFDDLDPARTALVVVDLQRGFMEEAVGHAVCPMAREIVPTVNLLAAVTRQAGGAVFWIKNVFDELCRTEWSVMQQMATPAAAARREFSMSEGSQGHELWPALDVRAGDEIVKKNRFSAFLPGASDLPERLRARGLDTVLITGTVTNICCELSARDAMMRNFRVIMVSDGNAAMTQEEHEASLTAFYLTFGDVMDTAMLIRLMASATSLAA